MTALRQSGLFQFLRRIRRAIDPLGHPYWRVVVTHQPLLRLAFTGMHDFILHELYWLRAAIAHRLRGSPLERSTESDAMFASMREHGLALVPDGEAKSAAVATMAEFWKHFERFQARHSPGYRPAMPVRYRGMLAFKAMSDNQAFFDEFTEEDVAKIGSFARATGIEDAVRRFFGCNVSSYNIRAWRYFPHPTLPQEQHRDNLPPHGLKVMWFRGEVDKKRGALSVLNYRGAWNIIEGTDQIVIFDSNRLLHESPAPQPGEHRDCIELTYMPEISLRSRYQASGPEAEHPVNPFREWSVPASTVAVYRRLWYRSPRLIGR